MRHTTSHTSPTRHARTAATLAAMAGIAWASCALAQNSPATAPPSIQQESQPAPVDDEQDQRLRDAQRRLELMRQRGRPLAPDQDLDQPEAEEPGAVRSEGGGITPEGTFSIDIEGPMDLSAFVELVSEALQINIIEEAGLQGRTVLFRAPLAIPMEEVIPFLRVLLEDAGFALVYDDLGFYRIRQEANLKPDFRGGPLATTRIIKTPLIRPSSLQNLITSQAGQAGPTFRMSAVDELGLLMVTGTPGSLDTVEAIVNQIIDEAADLQLFPFRLQNVSAVYARSRIIQLNGQLATGPGQAAAQAGQAGVTGALSNLESRLYLDQGNTLLFRGTEREAQSVANLVEVVDRITPLIVKRYVAGSVALEAARAGERLGLGPVTTSDEAGTGAFGRQQQQRGAVQQGVTGFETEPAVSGFTVDVETGSLIYYGTESQHAMVDDLVEQFKETAIGENIEIKTYKLLYAKAEAGEEGEAGVVDILQQLIESPQRRTTESPFIPRTGNVRQQQQQPAQADIAQLLEDAGIEGDGTRLIATTENTIIVSDPARNQIIIKAPAKAQEQFARIISQLDEKQPQVMIEVKIVALTASDNFNWAADVQFDFGQFSWFSGFGVTGAPESGDPFDPRAFPTPDPGRGLTTGIIKSDMVPIAIQALASVGKTRVLSNPSILVNDNTTADLASEREVPFSQSSQGTSTTITSQGGTATAGTTLSVTPRISEGGDITLEFDVELSDFTGPAQGGLQPPAQRDQYASSVTLPSDSTVVVGGFRLNRTDRQEDKVPILGDIPLLGALFKSYRQDLSNSVIFVFITPRIMRDPSGADLQLMTEGPMNEVDLDPDLPPLEPALIPIVGSLGDDDRLIRNNAAADRHDREETEETGPVASRE